MIFYGRKLGMDRQEILITRYGEMLDMITCIAIYNGSLVPKEEKKKLTYDEIMALR